MTGLAAALALALAAADPARPAYGAQLLVGVPFNVPTSLTIHQDGAPDLHVRARYSTRPFTSPIYYGVGLFRRAGGHEWSVELVHHKLYLDDPPPEVQAFSLSHGFNLVTVQRGFEVARGLWTRVGGGLVIGHPESTVRGRTLSQTGGLFGLGYHLAGGVLVAGLEGRVPLAGDRLRLAVGGRVTGAYAEVPVEGGHARVPNLAFHATAGLDGEVFR